MSKLWRGVSKGMLPVKHLAPKILMAVNYGGRQPDQKVQPLKLEGASITGSIMGYLIGTLRCGLERGK